MCFRASASDILPTMTSRSQGTVLRARGVCRAIRGRRRGLAWLIGTIGSALGIEVAGGVVFRSRVGRIGFVFSGGAAFWGQKRGFLGSFRRMRNGEGEMRNGECGMRKEGTSTNGRLGRLGGGIGCATGGRLKSDGWVGSRQGRTRWWVWEWPPVVRLGEGDTGLPHRDVHRDGLERGR